MKQTAVEWLLNEIDMQYPEINLRRKEWMVDKAKEMEKEQMFKCKGNNDNGCFMESPGHDCGCFERIQKEEPKQLTDLEIAIKLEEIEREEAKLNTCDIIFERAALIDIEENKQETTGKKFYESADAVITVYRQETIKKAAKSYRSSTANKMAIEQQAFQEGVKWQAERMYSEGEVETIAKDAYIMGRNNILIGVFNKWFEQYKKK